METNNTTGLTVRLKGWYIWPTMWAASPIYRKVDKLGSEICHLYSDSHEYLGVETDDILCIDGKIYRVA